MSFTRHSVPAVVLAALVSNAFAAGITFGPVKGQPGESVRLVTRSETPGGTIQRSIAGKNRSGTINITRDRELVWTFRGHPSPISKSCIALLTVATLVFGIWPQPILSLLR